MDSALQTALVSASIAAIVSLSVAVFSPLFTHHLWKRQKRKEQQLAIAVRFCTLIAEIAAAAAVNMASVNKSPAETELIGILYVIPVLFENEETVDRALTLLGRGRSEESPVILRIDLQGYLFAEALNISFKKIVKLTK
jgi:hypothetical protein